MFESLKQLHASVGELEDRYYSTTMAWEKELRDMIKKSNEKAEAVIAMES